MQGKIPGSAILLVSFFVLSVSTSGYATAAAADNAEPTTLIEILKKRFGGSSDKEVVAPAVAVETQDQEVKPAPKRESRPVNPVKKQVRSAQRPIIELPKNVPVPTPSPKNEFAGEDVSKHKEEVGIHVDESLSQEKVSEMKNDDPAITPEEDVVSSEGDEVGSILGFADSSWADAPAGFRFHVATARRMMTEGRPDLALAEIDLAKDGAATVSQVDEADRLRAVANVLMGKEVYLKIANKEDAPDWKAVEVMRAAVNGDKPSYSVILSLDEVMKWPDPVAALAIRHFAPIVDKKSADPVLLFSEKLHRSGSLNPSVMPLVQGYVYKVKGDADRSVEQFKIASTSVLGGVAGLAKLELLEKYLQGGSVDKQEVVELSTDIINIGSNDHVHRRALRILIDHVEGVEKVNALRSLEKIEPDEKRRAVINEELDRVLAKIAEGRQTDKGKERDGVVGAEVSGASNISLSDEPVWLLEDEKHEATEIEKTRISLSGIRSALKESNEIVRTFEEIE